MRVLFVVSSRYWITAVEAREIMKHNPLIRGELCSVSLLDELLTRAPYVAENVDLIHFMVPVAGRRYLDRFLGKTPCVATIHHIEPGYHPEAIPANARADAVMVVAKMWRSELISRDVPADRIVIVPNGVDTNVFRPPAKLERPQLRRSMGFTPRDIVIGFCGKPGRDNGWRKGLDVFIEALKILAQKGKPIAIVVGGPGWGAALEEIRAMGIKAYWRPYVLKVEEGAPMYRALDFYWVTSRIEGGPVPLLEAMSSGVCCISTKVGIAPEVIKDGINGCLVEIDDAPRIATLTRKLIESTEEREMMGREARSSILSGYDWSQTAKRALLLYKTAVANFERRLASSGGQDLRLPQRRSLRLPVHTNIGDSISAILSRRDGRWLEAQERLVWARELCRMGERRAAVGLGWRACLTHPFSIRTWLFITNLVFPRQVLELRRFLRASWRL